MSPVFRFAPSPNGYLHLGHAYSALLNAEFARRLGGRFLVRIEDIDVTRCKPELVDAALEDLAWLGLQWEGPVLRQSAHFQRYRAVAVDLEAKGLLYPCFCTRGDLAKLAGEYPARDPDGAPLYPGICRHLEPGERARRIAAGVPHALRLDRAKAVKEVEARPAASSAALSWDEVSGERLEITVRLEADPLRWGDVVIVRKECPTSYHLSVVLDDALQGVTHVVRGTDLYEATTIHRLLQTLLDLPAPVYHHHELVKDDAGRKLAKSAASKPLRELRAEGVSAADIRKRFGFS
ncbi:MAG: tRNA glutamyl-Q(34) synthetase GluQRS [Rhizobiales bacterium PAR1]|nr:MAG: tRNA glutamyl-Q(34) synthetase GluQRS [Rhizobiales bacterium PAR1]